MRIVVCGLGNKTKGDDGFGPYVIDKIKATEKIAKLHCGLFVENYLNTITAHNPDLIIFLDTVAFNNEKETVLLRNEEIFTYSSISVSTHNLPFSAIYQYLKENANADIFFVGVKPVSFQRFSSKVKKIADRLIKTLEIIDTSDFQDIIDIYESLSTCLG